MNDKIIYSDADSFETEVLKSNVPVIVEFYTDDCPMCVALAPVLDRMTEKYGGHIKFVRIHRQQNRQLAESLNVKSSPTVLFYKDGQEVCSRLSGYIGNIELKQAVESIIDGKCERKERQKVHCDLLILGGGPAGLSAAIYAARAKLMTVVVEEGLVGGQVATTFHVANYPGTNGVVRGIDLMENMKKQALDFGTRIDDMKEVFEIDFLGEEKYIKAEDTDYYAKAVIIATGASPRKLPAEGEGEYRGRGVHYCATCDGAMYQDANVLVIGGGNSAVEEAVFLTRYVRQVTIIHQLDHFQASKSSQEEVFKNPNINVMWNSKVRKVSGDTFLKSVTIEDLKTKEMREMETDGVFVYIGMQPKTELFKEAVKLSESGYIIVDSDMKTSIEGVFAAGDVIDKKIRQIATATGDGVVAGIMAERFINGK
jgi:thioredoxin reductase (NADPH)